MRESRIKYSEITLVILVWLVLLFTPILFREDIYSPLKRTLRIQLETLLPLLCLFLVNRFVLVPKLLYKGRQFIFILSVIGLIILSTCGLFYYDKKIKPVPAPDTVAATNQIKTPPYAFPGGTDPFGNLRPDQPRQSRPMPPFANFLIFSVLVVGFDTGLLSSLRWIRAENEKVRLEKENMASQLILLRNQVSPHFLMNTLNNIHSLVDVNTDEAKEAIIKLSKMMRYLLYETDTDRTTLKKEVEFLESYINLMKLRFNEKVRIKISLPPAIPDLKLPPFIFVSLIENAFKHGISYKDESFIEIDMTLADDLLMLMIRNSKAEKVPGREFSGIGIENTRKRLDLIYGNRYDLVINDDVDLFTVRLSIPLSLA